MNITDEELLQPNDPLEIQKAKLLEELQQRSSDGPLLPDPHGDWGDAGTKTLGWACMKVFVLFCVSRVLMTLAGSIAGVPESAHPYSGTWATFFEYKDLSTFSDGLTFLAALTCWLLAIFSVIAMVICALPFVACMFSGSSSSSSSGPTDSSSSSVQDKDRSPDLALSAEPAFTSTFSPLPRPQSAAEAMGIKNKASTTQCLDGHGNLVGWVQDSGGDCVYAYSRAKDGTVRLAGIYQRGIDRTSFSGRSVKGNQLMRQIPGI